MQNFLKYLIGTFTSPGKVVPGLKSDKEGLKYGLYSILLIGLLLCITDILFVQAKLRPMTQAVLNLPPKSYYFIQIFLRLPVFVIGWFACSALIHGAAVRLKAKSSLGSVLSVSGFALAVPLYLTWLFNTVFAALILKHALTVKRWLYLLKHSIPIQVLNYAIILIPIIWMVFLFSIIMKNLYQFKRVKAIILSVIVAAFFELYLFVFIR